MRFALRRKICRITFCVVCVLPTVLIGGAAVLVHSPAYMAFRNSAWQASLAMQLGLELQVTQLDRRPGGRAVLQGIELRDPESHAWLARARSADVVPTRDGWRVLIGQPELRATHIARLAQILHEHLLRRPGQLPRTVQFGAPTLTIQGDQPLSLNAIRGALDNGPQGAEFFVEFADAGSGMAQPARVRIVRNRQLDPPATGWELHTGSTPLPCALARPWWTALDKLGRDCSFCGSIWVEQRDRAWTAELSGRFEQLDLNRLVTGAFPHKLSGNAELEIERAQTHQGRLITAAGQLHSGAGVISRSLLESAEQSLGLVRSDASDQAELLRYKELAIAFSLDGDGLTIAGLADPPPAALIGDQGPLLSNGDSTPLSPLALLRLLVPQTPLQVPATRETAFLIDALPLPALSGPVTREARRSYSPLRLRTR